MACVAPSVLVLSPEQIQEAALVAKKLHDSCRRSGIPDGHGLRKEDATADMETTGSAAEMATAMMLGVKWTARNSKDKYGADIGARTQVRSTHVKRTFHHLIVRQRDLDKYGNVPFVLTIRDGDRFICKGWMMSEDVKRLGKLWDGGDSSRPPAFFLHESKLHPISTLENP